MQEFKFWSAKLCRIFFCVFLIIFLLLLSIGLIGLMSALKNANAGQIEAFSCLSVGSLLFTPALYIFLLYSKYKIAIDDNSIKISGIFKTKEYIKNDLNKTAEKCSTGTKGLIRFWFYDLHDKRLFSALGVSAEFNQYIEENFTVVIWPK